MLIRKIQCWLAVCTATAPWKSHWEQDPKSFLEKDGTEGQKTWGKQERWNWCEQLHLCLCMICHFLKLFPCICLFAGYKLFPSQASLCRSQILNIARSSLEISWSFPRLRFSACSPGGKKTRDELAPAGSGIIYVVPSWSTLWCPFELLSSNSVQIRDLYIVGEHIFKGYNLFFNFCTLLLQSWIILSF